MGDRLIIHLNGWPGVEKLTIGRIPAEKLGARLVDNQTLVHPAAAVLGFGSPGFDDLRRQVRDLAYEAIAERAPR